MELGRCVEEEPTIAPDLPDREVAERLASYNLLAIACVTSCFDFSVSSPSTTSSTARCRRGGATPAAGQPMRRREDVTTPRQGRVFDIHYDPDAFGQFSEAVARTLGTARFLVVQTALVVVWISLNVAWIALRWDKSPFILLNLAFPRRRPTRRRSSSSRKPSAERDRAQTELDRVVTAYPSRREFVARELAVCAWR